MQTRERSSRRSELPITYAVIEWLDTTGWPLIFPEVTIPRGLIRGRVDVAAASKGFRESVAVEVKAVYRPGDSEDQLSDAQRAAEYVYFAAPPSVVSNVVVPKSVGILSAIAEGRRTRLAVLKKATHGKPEFGTRRDFLHALMRSAMRRGRFDPTCTEGKACPACGSGRCPVWTTPGSIEVLDDDSVELE